MSSSPDLPRNLINDGGESFAVELASLEDLLGALSNADRESYRDQNAAAIATHSGSQMLIVAGPGAGKSHLFMARIKHWLPLHEDASIYVSSFVRKLVKDLERDVKTSETLEEADRGRVTVTTLHTLARSLLERNHGTADQSFQPHIKIISGEWEGVVWQDALKFHADLSARTYSHKAVARQFHAEQFDETDEWKALRNTYSALTRFYNAVGFSDLIVLARQALQENPELNSHLLWIIDEFQDFNPAEEHLIRTVVATARAVLIAGDDEQALYQQLKASLPEIIVSFYDDPSYANAMLPYCSRCSYYVCLAASGFIAKHRVDGAIGKVYLPLRQEMADPKVQMIATAAPASAVDYISKFIEEHRDELERHKARMEAGEETDPFLLILSPSKKIRFYQTRGADEKLRGLVSQWSAAKPGRSTDYWRVATYSAVAWDPTDNFSARKVLAYEAVDVDTVHDLLVSALESNDRLADVISNKYPEIFDKCKVVADALESDELDDGEKVTRVAETLPISDPDRLTGEVAAHPLQFLSILVADEGQEAIETAGTAAPVELMTMVGAKGLSAHHVIVIGCDDVNMKHVTPLAFFVALTRARRSLHLITSLKAGGGTTIHPFLGDLPGECCEYKTYRKSGRLIESLSDMAAFVHKLAAWVWVASGGPRSRRR
jgi:superfamily I DNA/RNA helicase